MTKSRLLLVVLIVLGLVFALGIGVGTTNKKKEPEDKKAYAKSFKSEGLSGLLTNVLSPVFPKLQPADISKEKSKAPLTKKRFPTVNMSSSLVLKIAPVSKDAWIPVRQAEMVRKRGAVKLFFKSPRAENESLRKQCIPSKKDCDDAQPDPKWDEENLTIPQEGGTLTLTCGDDIPCRVELKES